jgi:hypothetical protein
MSTVTKVLIGLASLAFLIAVLAALLWKPIGIPAESFSRASTNLALIAIALMLYRRYEAAGN